LKRLVLTRKLGGVRWKQVTLIGVGLLGGSLGLALKQRRLARRVVGFVRRRATIGESRRIGAVDDATLELLDAVAEADLVVLCTPIAQMRSLLELMLPGLKPGTLITDVGSVKGSVVRELETLASRAGAHFVGSHPMAGAEKTGVAAARADLFVNAVCVVTPTRKTNPTALKNIERLWNSVGARVVRMDAVKHDQLVSRSSHLPHVIAAQLASFVLDPAAPRSQALLCANGFRDTTRIASGSPELWRDIALANRQNLTDALGGFIARLQSLRRVLKRREASALDLFFLRAKQRRDKWSRHAGSPSPE
jgi:prephenate dehydrogenase